jgi:hypothetical protein
MIRRRKQLGPKPLTLAVLFLGVGVAIYGILAVIASVPTVAQMQMKRQRDLLSGKLELYKEAMGHYPTEEEGGLKALLVKPPNADSALQEAWKGPYIEERMLRDPWNNPILYKINPPQDSGTGSSFKLWFVGPAGVDRAEGGIEKW